MKKIILHIGAPKTATTLIQRCLEKSSLPLADLGICVCDFLGSSNHKLLPYTFREKNDGDKIQKKLGLHTPELRKMSRLELKRKFSDLSNQDSIVKLVISSEDLQSKLGKNDINNLSKFFHELGFNVSIIFYIREQASAINSHFSTALKDSSDQIKLRPKPFNQKKFAFSRYNYFRSVRQWRNCFPDNFKLLIYNKNDFYKGSIIDDFCFHSSIPFNIMHSSYEEIKNSSFSRNTSLTDLQVKLLNLFNNKYKKYYSQDSISQIFSSIKSLESDSKLYMMPEPLWQEIRLICKDSNEKIRQKFFPNRTQLFDFTNENIDYSSWALSSFNDIDFASEELVLGKILQNYSSKS